MQRRCNKCQAEFEISERDLKFYERVSPKLDKQRFEIPPPALCPNCRQQRRFSFRNERTLYRTTCDRCGAQMISLYSPKKVMPVYCQSCWWSEERDEALNMREFDFHRTFSEQFHELLSETPRISILNMYSQNSDLTNFSWRNKNCYLLVSAGDNEDCYYDYVMWDCKSCVDCSYISECELCYQCVYGTNCYNSYYLYDCQNCADCIACNDCHGCQNCILCQGLRNKEYFVRNQRVSREEYSNLRESLKQTLLRVREPGAVQHKLLELNVPHVARKEVQCENCLGHQLYQCRNCFDCYYCRRLEDCSFASQVYDGKDSYDCEFSDTKVELFYDGISLAGYHLLFCSFVWDSSSVFYSDHCFNCKNLFGCVGLNRKEYCILNRQYSEKDFNALLPRVIEHMQKTHEWGEFLSSNLSPFGYNETIASEYYPLEKQEAQREGFHWTDYEAPPPEVQTIIAASDVPEKIDQIEEDIVSSAISCETTAQPFRIIKPELDFYRRQEIPLPRRHPDQRHRDRLRLSGPWQLWKRNCAKCGREIETSFSPERPEIVYCTLCYLGETY